MEAMEINATSAGCPCGARNVSASDYVAGWAPAPESAIGVRRTLLTSTFGPHRTSSGKTLTASSAGHGCSWRTAQGPAGYDRFMASPDRAASQRVLEDLCSEDRAWLEEQLVRYRDLLAYLREH